MTNTTRVLFGFDWGMDALVMGGPTGPILIRVVDLQAMDWIATTEGFRVTLPRLDPSILDHPAPPFQNRAARRAKR